LASAASRRERVQKESGLTFVDFTDGDCHTIKPGSTDPHTLLCPKDLLKDADDLFEGLQTGPSDLTGRFQQQGEFALSSALALGTPVPDQIMVKDHAIACTF
jgi:hypothetical protein